SQPMGFYAPAQLIQDARRHGVLVLPVDVCASDWSSRLDFGNVDRAGQADDAHPMACMSGTSHASHGARGKRPAVRLGMSLVKGMSEQAAGRIVAARRQRPYVDTADLAHRADLNRHDLDA